MKTETQTVCGNQVQQDCSGGQGHCWKNIAREDIPADIVLEIEAEMIDGGREQCDDYVASNGQHYRWQLVHPALRGKRTTKERTMSEQYTITYYEHKATAKTLAAAERKAKQLVKTYGQGNKPPIITDSQGERVSTKSFG